ncbi:MAG TPA: glycosyltransferase family 4 protein, partial [Puia sp.]|nr:glycosyltransferase family 4 protein [Puia sp.]
MRVLYIHTYYRQRGGEDIVFENERSLMEASGCAVDSVTFNNKKFAVFKFILLLFNPFAFFKVCKAIDRFKPDVVHIHNWFFGASPSIFLAVRLKKIPLVHTIHNFRIICPSAVLFNEQKIYTDSITKFFPLRAIKKKVYRDSGFFTFWLLTCTRVNYIAGTWRSVDRFICLTRSSKEIIAKSILKINSDKISVKPNFVQSTAFVNECDRDDHFLFVGRLSEEKGVHSLLAAFANKKYRLTIIGDGPLKQTVEQFAKENRNITYLGFQTKENILQYMRDCSALIVPSICYEQFGLVIIEALSCGTPVLASDIGAPADIICEGYNGLHFNAGSTYDLINKIEIWDHMPLSKKNCFYMNAINSYRKHFTATS